MRSRELAQQKHERRKGQADERDRDFLFRVVRTRRVQGSSASIPTNLIVASWLVWNEVLYLRVVVGEEKNRKHQPSHARDTQVGEGTPAQQVQVGKLEAVVMRRRNQLGVWEFHIQDSHRARLVHERFLFGEPLMPSASGRRRGRLPFWVKSREGTPNLGLSPVTPAPPCLHKRRGEGRLVHISEQKHQGDKGELVENKPASRFMNLAAQSFPGPSLATLAYFRL